MSDDDDMIDLAYRLQRRMAWLWWLLGGPRPAGKQIGWDACPECGATMDDECKLPLVAALRAARIYVESAADDVLPNPAAEVLKQIDAALGG